jgi:sugar transferase (PEP-CTERM/EpsH1 system associated)
MRLVWIKVGGLWPLNTGGRLRTFELLSALSASHDITLVTSHADASDAAMLTAKLPQVRRVVSVTHHVPKQGTAGFGAAVVRSWASREPLDLWRWRVPAARRALEQLLRVESWDAIVADFLVAAPNVPRTRVPVVYFAHNVEHQIWRRLAAVERRPVRRAALEVEWRKVRRREARFVRDAAMTVAVSEADRDRLLADAPRARIGVIPTGVDVDGFRPAPGREVPWRVVFCGSMDWYPNEDAVLDFAEHVWPRVRAAHPDASFHVVGRQPSARVRELGRRPGVVVTGTVPDVRPYVEAADVCVVPLRVGGGTRIKIFEALAMGKAVVSTRVGAEGLGLIDGEHFLAADTHDACVDAIGRVCAEPGLRNRLGQAGRSLVESRYSWRTVASEFSRLLEDAAALSLRQSLPFLSAPPPEAHDVPPSR